MCSVSLHVLCCSCAVVAMASIGVCSDTSEAVELCESQGLFLKPIAKLNISVQLPQLKSPGASISNWEIMEKLKKMIKPDNFLVLKVSYCFDALHLALYIFQVVRFVTVVALWLSICADSKFIPLINDSWVAITN
jgi:hypothetical protein